VESWLEIGMCGEVIRKGGVNIIILRIGKGENG